MTCGVMNEGDTVWPAPKPMTEREWQDMLVAMDQMGAAFQEHRERILGNVFKELGLIR